ncbi:MAG: hypothetical protein BMS9Abin10_0908 [Gammaproteobacteria bacterium]|nr:MAG: hypothetical protein BMS9Abin10_0908 [Gammaproteobacteria bacterium]
MAAHSKRWYPCRAGKTRVPGRRHILFGLLIVIAAAGSGCQTNEYYVGPQPVQSGTPKNRNDVAVLSFPTYDGGYPNLALERVDGDFTPTLEKKFQLQPGLHELVITCDYTGAFGTKHYFGRQRLAFTAEAGRRYKAQVDKEKRGQRRCSVQLLDSSTKTVVSKALPAYMPLREDEAYR